MVLTDASTEAEIRAELDRLRTRLQLCTIEAVRSRVIAEKVDPLLERLLEIQGL